MNTCPKCKFEWCCNAFASSLLQQLIIDASNGYMLERRDDIGGYAMARVMFCPFCGKEIDKNG